MRFLSVKFTALSVLAALCFPAVSVQAQEDSADTPSSGEYQSPPLYVDSVKAPVFVEIELTNEGVTAYDSAGDRWTYDFEELRFVLVTSEPARAEGGREDADRVERFEAVETRCTEEKLVDYPSLTAVYVGLDEYVSGDIKSYGRVTVKGWVKGSVQSFNKTVLITSSGQVDGDVKAPQVEVKEGGIVRGEIIETPPYEIPVDVITTGFSTAGIWVVFGFTLGLALTIFLISALAPTRLAHVTECVLNHPVRVSLVGLLFLFLMPVIIVLVVLTVIGVLVVWLVPVAYFLAFAVGVCATSAHILAAITSRMGWSRPGMPTASIVGIIFYMGLWALVAVGFDPNSANPPGVLLLLLAIFSTCYPFLAGTGAVVLTRFGSRSYLRRPKSTPLTAEPAPAPAPPPIAQTPPAPGRLSPGPSTGPMPSDPGNVGH